MQKNEKKINPVFKLVIFKALTECLVSSRDILTDREKNEFYKFVYCKK